MRLAELTSYSNRFSHYSVVLWLVVVLLLLPTFSIFTPNSTAAQSRQNNPPNAVIDSPENGDTFEPNEVVHFDASSSSDPDNDSLSYFWDFGDGETGQGVAPDHSYSQPWVHVITLEVSDGSLNDTAYVVIIIGTGGGQNRPPDANITSPTRGESFSVDEVITFDASASTDPDEDELSFRWQFGDLNSTTGMVATHAYTETGVYKVTLIVNDGMYADTAGVTININNTPPVANAGEDQEGHRYEPLAFDGSASYDPDRTDQIVNFTWDMGFKMYKYGPQVEHSFDLYGKFTVILTVTDGNGDSDTDEVNVSISNAQPVAMLKVNSADTVVDTDIEFDATDSYDPDGEIEKYDYNFGDDSQTDWIEDAIVTHRYFNTGMYRVTLKVRDDMDDISEIFVLDITVTEKINQPPTVSFTFPLENDQVAGKIIVMGTATDPDSKIEAVEIKIDSGDWDRARIINSYGDAVEWEFDWDTEDVEDGVHTLTVRSYDGKKYSAEQVVSVTVNNRPTTYIRITVEVDPDVTMPGEDVEVSGTAKYDTNVPVKDANVKIDLLETGQSWTTDTNTKGKYSYEFKAPDEPGEYTVSVYITDGTLDHSDSKELTVQTPPDLSLSSDDISFITTSEKPVEKDRIKITAIIHNSGDVSAKAKISFYLDSTSKAPFHSVVVTVPKKGTVSASANWVAREGTWSIIVVISENDPVDPDSTNNQVSKELTIGAARDESEETGGGIFEPLLNLPTHYQYAIVGGVIVLILLLIIGLAVRRSKRKKKVEQKKQDVDRIDKVTGAVVFKPVEDKDRSRPSRSKVTVRMSMKAPVAVLIFAVLALIMMGLSLALPWYSYSAELSSGEESETMSWGYSLWGIFFSSSETEGIEAYSWNDEGLEILGFDEIINLYNTAQMLATVALILCILFLIVGVFGLKGKGKPLIILFGLLAFIICLIVPIYFMLQHPGAYAADSETELDKGPHASFFGRMETEEETMGIKIVETWGPGSGWYMAIFGFMFALCGFITAFKLPRAKPAAEPLDFEERPREIIFKPIEDEDRSRGAPEKAIVKFETIGGLQ